MKPIIGRDVFFVQRQLWLASLQGRDTSGLNRVLYVVLGIILTACLMAW